MPKVEFDLFKRIRLAYQFVLKQKGWGLYAECGMCRGIKIARYDVKDTGESYEAMYKCLDCGAVAKVREWWGKDK
jgi:uncharacterized Zn finger protein